ncbi:type II secretion system F family protein [Bacillus shivajii]|uniref:competence type IV pilus assembly protein ComGB n=1 Tax=Bacillus shivajii TaxID=1983719 RepID=UPI001CFA8515|nr:competence type IV pilus assembly protein ComGB [Bacillus shivajii]UCZ54572.1 type II secretion system F family protein [Bacillus shivajii]
MKRVFRNDLDRSLWLEDLVSLLEEGFSLGESLLLLTNIHRGRKRVFIKELYEGLLEGEQLSTQLRNGGFSKEIISYLYFMEKYGEIIEGLKNMKELLRKKYETQKQVKKTLNYPLFLFIIMVLMISVMAEGVLPQFEQYFAQMNHELPFLTRGMIFLLSLLNPLTLLIALFTLLLFLLWLNKKSLEEKLHFILKVPYIRTFTRSYLTYYFTAQLAPMLNHGFSLKQSLKVMSKESYNPFLQEEAKYIYFHLLEGEPLPEVLKERGYYEDHLPTIVALGEKKGQLGKELDRYANFLFEKYYEDMQNKISIAQPLILTLIGTIILVIFLSMMMPVFQMVDAM